MDKPEITEGSLLRIKITCRFLVIDSSTIIENGGVIISDGVIGKIGPLEELKREKAGKTIHLNSHILHPGFVNAHSHLELSFLKGKIKPKSSFASWVRALVDQRGKTPVEEVEESISRGINRLLETGTTCVGDITATGLVSKLLHRSGIRATMFHETLGYPPEVATDRFNELVERIASAPVSRLITNALSPHAVYSTSLKLMAKSFDYARGRNLPVSMHLCETREEILFSRFGKGPLKKMLKDLGVFGSGNYPGVAPLYLVHKAGGLQGLLVAHCNHPAYGDLARLKRANAKIVISPGSGQWFGRGISAPVYDILDRQITLALGTDSLASNRDLDMAAEARGLIRYFPAITGAMAFHIATQGGARALSLPEGSGTLRAGAWFDAVAVRIDSAKRIDPVKAIMSRKRIIDRVWVEGTIRYRNREVGR
ncbi:hypothetical protein MNBD_NITROSPINAE02-1571 [hydrothermal vent metagenome]|uniref:Amidohydrolase-related domain-containing protein n=1 Tax=hydrothermal vent metagenome TaxID=652676 RepID=A0A3B1CE45_9ZZZZ